ncbi:MAG: metallophosphoesterase [Lachnospiraceae bacterium]|nr:metallophosphoesterase [Lachnospiraceae bacterium]
MKKRYGLFAAGAAVAGLFAWNCIDTHRLTVSRYEIGSDKLKKDVRAVLVADLHDTAFGRDNKRLKELIEANSPDFILCSGDMVTSEKRPGNRNGQELMEYLGGRYKVIAADGNHEIKMAEYPRKFPFFSAKMYRSALKNSGVIFPYDDAEGVDDTGIYVSSLRMPLKYDRKFNRKRPDPAELADLCPKPVKGAYNILIAHDPLFFEEYSALGFDLVVSGHVHGGLVRLPKLGGVFSPDFSFFPRYDGGMYYKDGFSMIVSRGLGTHTVPVRIANPADLVVIDFKGA